MTGTKLTLAILFNGLFIFGCSLSAPDKTRQITERKPARTAPVFQNTDENQSAVSIVSNDGMEEDSVAFAEDRENTDAVKASNPKKIIPDEEQPTQHASLDRSTPVNSRVAPNGENVKNTLSTDAPVNIVINIPIKKIKPEKTNTDTPIRHDIIPKPKLGKTIQSNEKIIVPSSDNVDSIPPNASEIINASNEKIIVPSSNGVDSIPPSASEIINALSLGTNGADSAIENAYRPDPQYKPIPTYSNKKIERFIAMYTQKQRTLFERGLKRSVLYITMMKRIFREEGLPEELVSLSAVESNFNYKAVSRARAVGLWQFMSFTGREYNLGQSWWHDERYDPEKSTRAAAQFIKKLYRKFNDWELALAAYNSGPTRVRRALRYNKVRNLPMDYWSLKLPRETRGYVPAFLAVVHIMKNPEKYGFTVHEPLPEKETASLKVPGGVSLKSITKRIHIDSGTLKSLNPALKYQMTPGNLTSYDIRIPFGTAIDDPNNLYAALSKEVVQGWLKHKVRKGDTVWDISRYYGIRVSDIIRYNKKIRTKYIRPGSYLLIPSIRKVHSAKKQSIKRSSKKQFSYKYKVKKGDTLYKIALLYKTTIGALVKLNKGLRSRGQLLKIGMTLLVK